MLEIIAVIFLSRHIGQIAERKGLKKGWWIFFTVMAWIVGEFLGAVVGIIAFPEEPLAAYPFAIGFAVASYFILKFILSRKPDVEPHSFEFEGQNQQQ
jgi:hypothetical protein